VLCGDFSSMYPIRSMLCGRISRPAVSRSGSMEARTGLPDFIFVTEDLAGRVHRIEVDGATVLIEIAHSRHFVSSTSPAEVMGIKHYRKVLEAVAAEGIAACGAKRPFAGLSGGLRQTPAARDRGRLPQY
jgi:hypothetical protein